MANADLQFFEFYQERARVPYEFRICGSGTRKSRMIPLIRIRFLKNSREAPLLQYSMTHVYPNPALSA